MAESLTFLAMLEPDEKQPGFLSSQALVLPEARLGRVVAADGRSIPGLTTTPAGALLPADSPVKQLMATISVPAGLRTKDDLEQQKLEFEREKQSIAEKWQRRTFVWTIISALLGLVATIGGQALLKSKPEGIGVSVGQIEGCRNSLRRLVTLAVLPGQSVTDLGQAIRQHDATCDDLLVKLIAKGDK
jgi:hypothetical protein